MKPDILWCTLDVHQYFNTSLSGSEQWASIPGARGMVKFIFLFPAELNWRCMKLKIVDKLCLIDVRSAQMVKYRGWHVARS